MQLAAAISPSAYGLRARITLSLALRVSALGIVGEYTTWVFPAPFQKLLHKRVRVSLSLCVAPLCQIYWFVPGWESTNGVCAVRPSHWRERKRPKKGNFSDAAAAHWNGWEDRNEPALSASLIKCLQYRLTIYVKAAWTFGFQLFAWRWNCFLRC